MRRLKDGDVVAVTAGTSKKGADK
ncbi:hypothetical protein ACFFW8_25260 [Erwinia tracheiphila]